MDTEKNKLTTLGAMLSIRKTLQEEKKILVFTNGCFDILHAGHVRYLWEARRMGDKLVVAINSDSSTTSLKGKGRPIIPENITCSNNLGIGN